MRKVTIKHQHSTHLAKSQENNYVTPTSFPCFRCVSYRISKVLRRHNVKTFLEPSIKFFEVFPYTKVPCYCHLVYIRETGQSIKTCLDKHKRYSKSGNVSFSAVTEHYLETDFIIWEETPLVDSVRFLIYPSASECPKVFACSVVHMSSYRNLVPSLFSWSCPLFPSLFESWILKFYLTIFNCCSLFRIGF